MKIKTIISISGRISSGKSYAANLISKEFGFPIASFGNYLKDYCHSLNLPTDRKTLQDIGENLAKSTPYQFSSDVINHFINGSDSLIIEGVRHKTIFQVIKDLSDNCLSVFIDANQKTRYERYYARNKYSDELKTYDQFMIFDNHPVELEIESLKPLCNVVVDSTIDYTSELLTFLSQNLK